MRHKNGTLLFSRIVVLVLLSGVLMSSCSNKDEGPIEFAYETNLLKNASFEELDKEGFPKDWKIVAFRGLQGQAEVEINVDTSEGQDGENSVRFNADPGTRRFYAVTQEVEMTGQSHVRLQGWLKIDQVDRKKDQYAQCNFLVTYYDENHNRFQEMRFADKRSRLVVGTQLWKKEDLVFRVPEGARYVAVSCVLGMDGTAWFDNVSLSVPKPLDWETTTTKNFEFHWFADHPFPAGAIVNQQAMFDHYASRLDIDSDVVIKYYLYPDTASIRDILSLRGHQYVSWDDHEFHSINPNDDHEIIHFMTDEYGMPPRSIAEGTVFWLHDNWAGYPIHKVAAYRLRTGNLASLADLTNYNDFALLDPGISFPSIASFVGFLAERWGPKKLMEYYRELNGVNSFVAFAPATEKVYGLPLKDIADMWVQMLMAVDISDLPDVPTEMPENLGG